MEKDFEGKRARQFQGKKVLVVGMGKSGLAVTQALLKIGASVTVQDIKKKRMWILT